MNQFIALSEEDYHNDPCDVPSLNQSIATILHKQSAKHAHMAHPRLGGKKYRTSDAFDKGTAIHTALLGVGKVIVPVDAADWRTKAAREQRDAIRATGNIPMLADKARDIEDAASAIRKQLDGLGVHFNGHCKLSMQWTEQVNGHDVLCRGRLDHFNDTGGYAYVDDLKSSQSANPVDIQRSCENYNYDIQAAAYLSGVTTIRPDLDGRVRYRWIFFELEPPYIVTVAYPTGANLALGAVRWDRALRLWQSCLSKGTDAIHWPGYSSEPVPINPPDWALRNELHRGFSPYGD